MKLLPTLTALLVVVAAAAAAHVGTGCTPDGYCDWPTENCASCAVDCNDCPTCARGCGNGVCEAERGEDGCTCPQDCGNCCANAVCEEERAETFRSCPSDCGVTLAGAVVDAATGRPLDGGAVSCRAPHSTQLLGPAPTEEASARFAFAGVEGGVWTCAATHPHADCGAATLEVLPATLVNTTVVLACHMRTCAVQGSAFNVYSEAGVGPTTVHCDGAAHARHTSPDGAFFFTALPAAARVRCVGDAATYDSAECDVECGDDGVAHCELPLRPHSARISGHVEDEFGVALANSPVTCTSLTKCTPGYDVNVTTTTDADGNYDTLASVIPGDVRCTACPRPYLFRYEQIEIGNGASAVIDFACQQVIFEVVIEVRDRETKEPCARAQVSFWRSRSEPVFAFCRTDGNGRCTLELMVPLPYDFLIELRGYEPLFSAEPLIPRQYVDRDTVESGIVFELIPDAELDDVEGAAGRLPL